MSELHVVFGAGPLGRAVTEACSARGRTVRVVSRSGRMEQAPAGIELVAADLYDAGATRAATKGAVAAYQCAQPAYHEWPQKFPPLQAAIIAGLEGAGTKLIIAENLYMYGQVAGPMTESLPYAATTRKGRVRAQMARSHAGRARERQTTRRHRPRLRLLRPLGSGLAVWRPGLRPCAGGQSCEFCRKPGRAAHRHLYPGLRPHALVALGERDEALGQAWHVPNDCPDITQRQFGELLFKAAGKPAKLSATSRTMMAVAGLFVPAAARERRDDVRVREAVRRRFGQVRAGICHSGHADRAGHGGDSGMAPRQGTLEVAQTTRGVGHRMTDPSRRLSEDDCYSRRITSRSSASAMPMTIGNNGKSRCVACSHSGSCSQSRRSGVDPSMGPLLHRTRLSSMQ